MADVRALVTQAMRKHWLTTETPDSLADVLFSLAGIAIVGLPPPDDGGDYLQQKPHVDVAVKATGVSGIPIVVYGESLMPAYFARILAGALLAAANAAEQAPTNV